MLKPEIMFGSLKVLFQNLLSASGLWLWHNRHTFCRPVSSWMGKTAGYSPPSLTWTSVTPFPLLPRPALPRTKQQVTGPHCVPPRACIFRKIYSGITISPQRQPNGHEKLWNRVRIQIGKHHVLFSCLTDGEKKILDHLSAHKIPFFLDLREKREKNSPDECLVSFFHFLSSFRLLGANEVSVSPCQYVFNVS